MANFDTSDLGGPQGSTTSVKSAVTDGAAATALGFLAGGVEAGLSVFGEVQKQKKQVAQEQAQKMQDSALGEFRTATLDIADAVASGQRTSAQGARMLRDNLRQFGTANPAMYAEARKIQDEMTGTTGAAKVIGEGSEKEQQYNKMLGKAMEFGYAIPGMTPDEQRQGVANYISVTQESEKNKIIRDKNATLKSTLETQKMMSEAEKTRAESKLAANTAVLNTSAQTFTTSSLDQLDLMSQKIRDSLLRPDQDNSNLIVELELAKESFNNEMNEYDVSNVDTSALRKQFNDRANFNIKFLSGGVTKETHDKMLASMQTMDNWAAMQDPDVRTLASKVATLGPNMVTQQEAVKISSSGAYKISSLYATGSKNDDGSIKPPPLTISPFPGTKQGKKDWKSSNDHMKSSMKLLKDGKVLPEEAQQVSDEITNYNYNTLKSVVVYGEEAASPKDFDALYNYVNSKEFEDWSTDPKTNYQKVMAPISENVKDVMKRGYTDKVQGVVTREMDEVVGQIRNELRSSPSILQSYDDGFSFATSADNAVIRLQNLFLPEGSKQELKPNEDLPGISPKTKRELKPSGFNIYPVFRDGIVSFKANGAEDEPIVRHAIAKLNRKAGPILTKVVRGNALLSGSNDFERSYNAMINQMYPDNLPK